MEEYSGGVQRAGAVVGEWSTTLDNEVISTRDTHNHPVDAAELEADKIVATMKRKAMETAQPIPTLYQSEIHQVASRRTDWRT